MCFASDKAIDIVAEHLILCESPTVPTDITSKWSLQFVPQSGDQILFVPFTSSPFMLYSSNLQSVASFIKTRVDKVPSFFLCRLI